MTIDTDVVIRRLRAIRELLDHLTELNISTADHLIDLGVRLQTERILTQVVNLSGEINAHLATVTLGVPPEDLRRGFDLAARAGYISSELAKALKPSVGLRNILTHQYVDIDLEIVAASIPRAQTEYREYVKMISRGVRK